MTTLELMPDDAALATFERLCPPVDVEPVLQHIHRSASSPVKGSQQIAASSSAGPSDLDILDTNGDGDGEGSGGPARPGVHRLARKAESARQARLRHKSFVTELEDQAKWLNLRASQLKQRCAPGMPTASG